MSRSSSRMGRRASQTESSYAGGDITVAHYTDHIAGNQAPTTGPPQNFRHLHGYGSDLNVAHVHDRHPPEYRYRNEPDAKPELLPRLTNNQSDVERRLSTVEQAEKDVYDFQNALQRRDHELQLKKQELYDVRNDLNAKIRRLELERDSFDGRARADLLKKDQELEHLRISANADRERKDQELEQLRMQASADLQKKDKDIEDFRKRWRQTTAEFNKFKAQGQGFSPVTDAELIQKVTQLRYNIRNFGIQHFGGDSIDVKHAHGSEEFVHVYLGMSPGSFDACMQSPSKRPMVVGAFLWSILQRDIFNKFCWAGTHISDAMSRLAQKLEPDGDNSLASNPETKRKFHTWRANTATLLVDAMNLDQASDRGNRRNLVNDKITEIYNFLRPFTRSKPKDLDEQLSNIIDEALDLDKLISKQVAEVIWIYASGSEPRRFNQALMEQDRGERYMGEGQSVWLELAPGVVKRGKSTGEDFNMESIMFKIEVSCEPPTFEQLGESQKAGSASWTEKAKGVTKGVFSKGK